MIDPEQKICVVVESTRDVETVSQHLFRTGYDNVQGYLHQGMASLGKRRAAARIFGHLDRA